MKVSELGEFGLIARIREELGAQERATTGLGPHSHLLIGIGDDAAVWQSTGAAHIATTDTLVAGVHFPRENVTWTDLGWKALAVNVSDIAAMGGMPEYALVTLALPDDFLVEDVVALYKGMSGGGPRVRRRHRRRRHGARRRQSVITVALRGRATESPRGEALRSAATPLSAGDVIAVSGSLGNAAGGLRLLREDRPVSAGSRGLPATGPAATAPAGRAGTGAAADGHPLRDRRQRRAGAGPAPHLRGVASARPCASPICPISDHLSRTFPDEAVALAVSGGEDYELLFTGPVRRGRPRAGRFAIPITVIGEIVEDPKRQRPLPRRDGA